MHSQGASQVGSSTGVLVSFDCLLLETRVVDIFNDISFFQSCVHCFAPCSSADRICNHFKIDLLKEYPTVQTSNLSNHHYYIFLDAPNPDNLLTEII